MVRQSKRGEHAAQEKVILTALQESKGANTPWLTAAAISGKLMKDHGVQIHWRTIEKLLKNAAGNAATRKYKNRPREFAITAAGEQSLRSETTILLIDPERAIQATATLHGLLGSLKGTVRVCDPYLDSATIEHLDACAAGVEIRLLTQVVRDSGSLRRLIAAAAAQGRNLQIRVVAAPHLHDRYLMDDDKLTLLGTSLNGFGKKQSFVIRAGEDIRDLVRVAFDAGWTSAKMFP